jgi:hypothetical protein
MNAEQILIVTGAVVALTQLVKWMRLVDDGQGPLVVLGLSALGVVLWAVSFVDVFERHALWTYFAAWIAVATSTAGVYGFTRARPESITATRRPPAGAAQSTTAPPRG